VGLLQGMGKGSPMTLFPGDTAFALRGEQVETLLGSCVGVILTTHAREAAAMCHYMYSNQPPAHRRKDTAYAQAALPFLWSLMQRYRRDGKPLQAFVYGGAHMFAAQPEVADIGLQNTQWAMHYLESLGIQLAHKEVGGTCHRKVAWRVGPGLPQVQAGPDSDFGLGTPPTNGEFRPSKFSKPLLNKG
jgi:chemotaxis protein CheD